MRIPIALGLDTGLLTRISLAGTSRIEQALVGKAGPVGTHPGGAMAGGAMMAGGGAMTGGGSMQMSAHGGQTLPIEGELPPLSGAVAWLNTPPLTPESLRGKVVLVDFWTYSCINCLRTLPYVRAWASKYKDHGLVVIGVHTPEFAFEKNLDNVRRALKDLGITYPVAVDNSGFANVPTGLVTAQGQGVEAAADEQEVKSPETYVGYARAENFAKGVLVKDQPNTYSAPSPSQLNQWGLGGVWTVEGERAVLDSVPGRIVFRFHARDLHLVLGPTSEGKPVRFRVLLDGKAPGEAHGVDVDATGAGTVSSQRLYQLIRQTGAVQDRTFTIEFQDAGVQAFSFTFG